MTIQLIISLLWRCLVKILSRGINSVGLVDEFDNLQARIALLKQENAEMKAREDAQAGTKKRRAVPNPNKKSGNTVSIVMLAIGGCMPVFTFYCCIPKMCSSFAFASGPFLVLIALLISTSARILLNSWMFLPAPYPKLLRFPGLWDG
jgi:hypothetical protein